MRVQDKLNKVTYCSNKQLARSITDEHTSFYTLIIWRILPWPHVANARILEEDQTRRFLTRHIM